MAGTVLQVVESFGEWRLLDDRELISWFQKRGSTLEAARVIVDARHEFDVRPTCVLITNGSETALATRGVVRRMTSHCCP